ncbi:MAG: hypothetical protein BROFUL_01537 [Candidatus Brocadia fulgida]|uniref:Uncharacterized protein n=1 Tax=Candidatus Brocadia fulgida TaxID=380242 RepID=A0A0M2UXR8_9BACT|nr:MAG: hypothetical protein BROFUL_01537 [Candidatus Brocadia fulgida]
MSFSSSIECPLASGLMNRIFGLFIPESLHFRHILPFYPKKFNDFHEHFSPASPYFTGLWGVSVQTLRIDFAYHIYLNGGE